MNTFAARQLLFCFRKGNGLLPAGGGTSLVLTWWIWVGAVFATYFGSSSLAGALQSLLEAGLSPGLGGLGSRVLENEMASGGEW